MHPQASESLSHVDMDRPERAEKWYQGQWVWSKASDVQFPTLWQIKLDKVTLTLIPSSSRGICLHFVFLFINQIFNVFLEFYASRVPPPPFSPGKPTTLVWKSNRTHRKYQNTIFCFFLIWLLYGLWMNVCGCLHISVHSCVFHSTNVRRMSVLSLEAETTFGLGALLWREKFQKEKKKKSPQVTDGNFSGPTMLQSISLH